MGRDRSQEFAGTVALSCAECARVNAFGSCTIFVHRIEAQSSSSCRNFEKCLVNHGSRHHIGRNGISLPCLPKETKMTNTPNMAANAAASPEAKPDVATPAQTAPATPDTTASPAVEPAKKV